MGRISYRWVFFLTVPLMVRAVLRKHKPGDSAPRDEAHRAASLRSRCARYDR
jgi:hypothetical protein